MKNHEYIHINEAVNVYNKTRQTFYNYIKKGQIASKKINNKVYLKIHDIEKIMSDYIHLKENASSLSSTQGEIIDPEEIHQIHDHAPEQEQQKTNIFEEKIQKDLLLLHKQYYNLKDDVIHEIKHSKQDTLFDTKAMMYNQEQRIITNISQQYKEISQYKTQINKTMSRLLLKNKKISFWLGYALIILLQFVLGSYIL